MTVGIQTDRIVEYGLETPRSMKVINYGMRRSKSGLIKVKKLVDKADLECYEYKVREKILGKMVAKRPRRKRG